MTYGVALCAMALLDGALAGFRAVAGRDAHIHKRALFRRWIARGIAAATVALVSIGMLLGAMLATTTGQSALFDDMVDAGVRMLIVFVPYVAVVLVALAAYVVPNLEVRCLATTIVLGPLTMARPAVILCGAVAAAWTAPGEVRVAAFVVVTIMLAIEFVMHRWATTIAPAGLRPVHGSWRAGVE